jgi:Lon protease-like protein
VAQLIPIFPLDLVLLPGVPLPLHIFEPRYREMVDECWSAKKPFGVVRAKSEEGIAEIGCTAEIVEIETRHQDGRMDIVTVGRQPFEILEVKHDRSFLQAEVVLLEDEKDEESEPSTEDRERALGLFEEVLDAVGSEVEIDQTADALSFQMAGMLPIDLDFKQALLGVRSEAERLSGLLDFFEAILPRLKKVARRREKAGGNGHAL